MREAKIAFAVLFIENRSSFFSHEGTVYDRLSAAADTSARAGHDFDEIIGNLTLIEGCQKLVGIAESIDNSNLKLDTGKVKCRFFPAVHTADCLESVRIRIRSCYQEVSGAQSSFHNTTGCAKDIAGAGADAQRHVERFRCEISRIDMCGSDQADDFSVCECNVDIRITAGIIHALNCALMLLCETRHDRDRENLARVNTEVFGIVTLGDCTEHLLRRLR